MRNIFIAYRSRGMIVLSVNIDDNIKTEVDFIDAIDSIRFVVLKDSTIMGVSKIVPYDSCYYILDKMQNAISILDIDGNLKYKLSKKGRSRQEYLEITDLSVSSQKITVYDQISIKIIDYDINTRDYLSSFDVQDIYSNICHSDDDFLVAYCSYGLQSSTNKMLTLYSSNTISNYIDKPPYLNDRINIEQSSPISRYMNQVYLTPLFSNFVYCIKSDSVKAKYYIDFCKHQVPERFYEKLDNGDANNLLSEIYKSNYAHSVDHFIETENYIYFVFAYNIDDYSVYYNKVTAEFSLYKKTSFGDNSRIWACNDNEGHSVVFMKNEISLLYVMNIY